MKLFFAPACAMLLAACAGSPSAASGTRTIDLAQCTQRCDAVVATCNKRASSAPGCGGARQQNCESLVGEARNACRAQQAACSVETPATCSAERGRCMDACTR